MKWAPRNVQLLFWHGCAYVRNIHGDVPTASCLQRAEAQLSSKRGLGKAKGWSSCSVGGWERVEMEPLKDCIHSNITVPHPSLHPDTVAGSEGDTLLLLLSHASSSQIMEGVPGAVPF